MIQILRAQEQEHYQIARKLFLLYADSLDFDLEFQGFSQEVATLPGNYAPPEGCIQLAEDSGHFVGCVAFYYSLEFRNINAYRYNPVNEASYMELEL